MDYFAGLDISMDETHVCVLDREGVVVRESKTDVDSAIDRGRIGESAELSSDRVRDRTHGADPVSRVEPTRSARGLRGEPAGLPGAQVARDPQDRSQRRARSGAFGSHRVLQARAREVAARARRPLVDHRAQEAGRPAGDLGKSDPWFRDRVRDPAALARSPSPSSITPLKQARGSPVSLPPCGV